MTNKIPARYVLALLSVLTLGAGSAWAQAAPSATPAGSGQASSAEDETIVLSPFVVESTEDTGYAAKSTLAGTRVRTDLRDIASSITVVTAKFLQDTGATNQQSLLVYTPNTEVGGVQGNFGGLGSSNGLKENSALAHPNQNTRVRGLDSADNTRDYFLTDIPWDSYIVDRVDLQRGPNSILFGVGSPAGIVNTQLISAQLNKNSGKFTNRIGSFGSLRDSLDVNYVLLKDRLGLRIAALDDDTKYRQEPAFNHDRRIFAALRFDPKLFGDSAHTSIKANIEHGVVNANRPRSLPPLDQITPFYATSPASGISGEPLIGRRSFEPWEYQFTANMLTTGANNTMGWIGNASTWNPSLGASMARLGSADPVFWFNSNSNAPIRVQQSNISTSWAIAKDGTIDKGIDGLPFAHPVSINGFNSYAKNAETRALALGLADPYPGAQKNYYKDKTLTDPSIFDFYNKLIDGPNKSEEESWNAYNLNVSQSFFDNRLAFEFAYDRQMYRSKQELNLSDTPFISIDVNSTLINGPTVAASLPSSADYIAPVPNLGFGRAYVGSSSHYGNSEAFVDRNNLRFTAYGELRATDFMNKSALTDFLGSHRFNIIASKDTRKTDTRNFVRYATDTDWALNSNETTNISQGFRQVDWITYLSGDLSGQNSASGAHIDNISVKQSPVGSVGVQYFDSRWKPSTNPADPNYVDPAAAWQTPFYEGASTQSENPANYNGWSNTTVRILNADQGDKDQLYTDATKLKTVVDSRGFTWQGYLWDDTIVPVFGYRKDRVRSYSANAPTDPITGVASMDYQMSSIPGDVSEGISRSWGGVLHAPQFIRKNLPWGSDISLSYNHSTNFRAENRVDFQGGRVPNAEGKTDEYGVIFSTLDGKISLRTTFYKTLVTNANLSGDPASSTLGANTYWLYLAEAWGAGSAVADEMGLSGNAAGSEWYWDWANNDIQSQPSGAWPRTPESAAIDAHEKAAADAWIATMQPQSFFDAYGIPVNVANIQAAAASGNWAQDPSNFIGGGWGPNNGPGGIQAAGAGKIRGLSPVGTIDNESKGVEFELTAQPTPNWNLTFNASKTTASRTNLSKTLSAFIEATHERLAGDAGDLRTWWAGDTTGTFRANYNNNIYAAYQFQLEQDGQSAPEVHPWAYNLITNYSFDRGLLKGFNVGGGFRWQDRSILGYRLIAAPTDADPTNVKLDVNQPIYGASQSNLDLWMGYERKLNEKINWRIQLNVQNFARQARLITVSVQPDGSPAAQRIQEGMTWTLSNTFSF
jgi:outer membrane receptor protein involved in Fe transport